MMSFKDYSLLLKLRHTIQAAGATTAEREAASKRIAAIEAGTDNWRDWLVEDEANNDCGRTSSGHAVCPVCGRILYDHAYIPGELDYRGHPYLRRSCDGRVHKL